MINTWKNKKALVIGDSITAAGIWQLKLSEKLEMEVHTHAAGGISSIQMVDGCRNFIEPLNKEDVKDIDLIIALAGYNERSVPLGNAGDMYPEQDTINGRFRHMINRIYEELERAENLKCRILFAAPHCAGRYCWVDADGYEEFPKNSGQSMEKLADTICEVCGSYSIPVCDLWHNSGINRYTWNIFSASKEVYNTNFAMYALDENGNKIDDVPLCCEKGKTYRQIRDGKVVSEVYEQDCRYPYYADQLHCSRLGYERIGECIVGSVISSFGN